MEISLLLLPKILELLLLLALGYACVKFGVLSQSDSYTLSRLSVYLIMPSVFLQSFQIDKSPAIISGLLLGVLAALLVLAVSFVATYLLHFFYPLNITERCSIIYSNGGSLTIPIVLSVWGSDWLVYTCSFTLVQMLLLWTHGKSTIMGAQKDRSSRMLSTLNITALLAGALFFFAGIRFPPVVSQALGTLSQMVGPVAMLVTGMLLAGVKLCELRKFKRLPLVLTMRLLVCPIVVLLLFHAIPLADFIPNGKAVLTITFLSCATGAAATIPQMAQLAGKDAAYASVINLLGTILCAGTMPLLVSFL